MRGASLPEQEVVLGYWQDALDGRAEEIAAEARRGMAAMSEAGLPYLIVAGAEPEADYRSWLHELLSQATFTVWPESGHFPHVARPRAFARLLAGTSGWPTATTPAPPPHPPPGCSPWSGGRPEPERGRTTSGAPPLDPLRGRLHGGPVRSRPPAGYR